ncbi:MAG: inositol monophosphatase [Bacteroidetes bacterium]|nr:inositol monophosphatase [Bacteroidota bacterium]
MNYLDICNQTVELAREVGHFIKNERDKISSDVIEAKGTNDFVTYVDQAAEKKIIEKLSRILPESGFIAEEGTSNKKGEVYNWIIDPLDGTTNFIHGAPPYAVSIGLMENDRMVVGVVYEITLDECFYAAMGHPAYLNGKEITVSQTSKVAHSLIATGFPYTDFHRMETFMETLKDLFKNSHGVRRLGSAATDLAYVACGRYDAFYEYNLKPWDAAAGVFIIQQAGGHNSTFSNTDDYLFGKELVSTNKILHKEFLKHVECLKIANFLKEEKP